MAAVFSSGGQLLDCNGRGYHVAFLTGHEETLP